jgi:aldose 1-epimerase
MSYIIEENRFDSYETVILKNNVSGEFVEIARMGATLLSYNIPFQNSLFNIVDGFADEEELKAARGARSWIMVPFANRIPGGKYDYKGKEYALLPVGPRTRVIHGFASYIDYEIKTTSADENGAEVVFETRDIRPGAYIGYPFPIDVRITYR